MTKDSFYIAKVTNGVVPFFNITGQERRTTRTGVFLCLKGSARISLDNVEYTLKPHSMTIYFAFSNLVILEKSLDIEGIVIGGDLEIIQPLLYNISDFNSLFMIRKWPVTILSQKHEETFLKYIELINDVLLRLKGALDPDIENVGFHHDMRKIQLEQLILSMMFEVVSFYNHYNNSQGDSNRQDDVLMRFISSLYKNYKIEHEVKFYSDQQYLTSRYFSAIVKNKSGKTPSQWIATALLVDAKKQLRQTSLSVKEISENLSFPNQSYFGKWFKNLTGISPLEYKNGKEETKVTVDEFTELVHYCSFNSPSDN